MKDLFRRWSLESPKLFKRIGNMCIALGTVGGAIISFEGSMPGYAVVVAPHLIVAGIVGGVISKLTVKDPNKI